MDQQTQSCGPDQPAPDPAGGGPSTIRSAWRYRRFRRLISALAVSQAGDWLYNVALLVFVYDRSHSAGWVSITTVLRVLPIVLLGPLGGVVADRFDRRRTMIVSDLLRMLSMLALAGVVAFGLPVVLAPMLAFLATAAGSAYPPCTAASTPRLVPAGELPGANALRSVIGPACIIGGPALGALLLGVTGTAALFAINAVTFGLSAVLIAAIPAGPAFQPASRADADEAVRLLAELGAGLAELRRRPIAARLVGADIACSMLYGAQTVLLVLLSRRLGWADHGYGLLLAAAGAGGVVGTVLVGRLSRFRQLGRLIGVALLGAALPLAIIPALPSLLAAMVLVAVTGLGAMVVEVFTETALQQQLDEAVFGRAYGFAFPASIGGIAAGSLLAAPLAGLLGLVGALVTFALLATGYAGWLLLREPRPAVSAPAMASSEVATAGLDIGQLPDVLPAA